MTIILNEACPNGVHNLRLNRPEVRNALNLELREALAKLFRKLDRSSDVRVIVVTGEEKAFDTGADLPLSAALTTERTAMQLLFDTEDQNEGMAVFLEKRKPALRGE